MIRICGVRLVPTGTCLRHAVDGSTVCAVHGCAQNLLADERIVGALRKLGPTPSAALLMAICRHAVSWRQMAATINVAFHADEMPLAGRCQLTAAAIESLEPLRRMVDLYLRIQPEAAS